MADTTSAVAAEGAPARPRERHSTSESEEMYLITIAMAVEDGHAGPVPVPHLAEAMAVSRVSANEMVKKLVGRGFVDYTPYKGVSLTEAGASIARGVLRRRRLWGLFLSEHLGLSAAAADTVACEFEHITPGEVVQRLSHFLGDPTVGPEGKPIPSQEGNGEIARREFALSEMGVGRRGVVVRTSGDPAVRSFLAEEGVSEGAAIVLLAIGEDRGCLVETTSGHTHLSSAVADRIFVAPVT
jgi:DtxR family transcriptional regulator, Mn-dependent transcriptional regulator